MTENFLCIQDPWALHRAAAANKAGAVRRLLRDGDWIADQQDDEVRLH